MQHFALTAFRRVLQGLTTGLVLTLGGAFPAAAQDAFESPPILPATDFISPDRLQGEGYRVDPAVPTDGFRAHFTLYTDYGEFRVVGSDLLEARLREVAAMRELERMSRGKVFASSLQSGAVDTGAGLKHAAENPKETAQGLPEGVGRFFQRAARAGKSGVQKIEDQQTARRESGDAFGAEHAEQAAGQAASVTADAMGLDEERRKLAKQLGVNPYTTNEVLSRKLDEIAKAAFAGSLGVRVATSAIPGGRLISTTTRVNDWVWDTPPGDLRVAIDRELRALGATQDSVDRFLRHPAYSLTMQATLQVALSEMEGVEGRVDVLPWALSAESPDDARFVVLSVHRLARYHREVAPLASIEIPGPLAGRTRAGELAVVVAVDYLAWTKNLSGFASQPDPATARSFWLSGRVSPRTRAELTERGWAIHERSLLDPLIAP
jgi:hypothetical protein